MKSIKLCDKQTFGRRAIASAVAAAFALPHHLQRQVGALKPGMLIDSLLGVDDAHAYTATAFTTNTVDLGNVTPKRQIGDGEPMALVWTVDVAADTSSGDETYQFELVQSANADLSSPDKLAQTDTALITRSTLVAGYVIVQPIPPGFPTKRYIGGRITCGGTTPTITVTAEFQPLSMVDKRKDYAKGFTIS